jgi:hypothetical protein
MPYFFDSSLVSRFNLRDSSISEYVEGRGLPCMCVPATNETTADTNFSEGLLPRDFMGYSFWIVDVELGHVDVLSMALGTTVPGMFDYVF